MNYDRVILELIDRVSALEDEVRKLKAEKTQTETTGNRADENEIVVSSTGRDTTKYMLDGKRYAKNRLVLAVVRKYMAMHANLSAAELIEAFDKSLQGSLGVVRTLSDVQKNCSDYKTRFFANPEEQIQTSTQPCVVCTQWGIANIGNILAIAEQYGIDIIPVK